MMQQWTNEYGGEFLFLESSIVQNIFFLVAVRNVGRKS